MLQSIAALSLFTDLADPQERESCNLPQAKHMEDPLYLISVFDMA